MCLFRKCRLQGLHSRQNEVPNVFFVGFLFKKPYKIYRGMNIFGDKRNTANGALWTDTDKRNGQIFYFSNPYSGNICFVVTGCFYFFTFGS